MVVLGAPTAAEIGQVANAMVNASTKLHRQPAPKAPLTAQPVAWARSVGAVAYEAAVAAMEARVAAIARGEASELLWFLEHAPIYTAGTSARPGDLLDPDRFPVHRSGRGGQYTYHGPGQRVVYVMLDVKRRTGDLRAFVGLLERWLITTLAGFGVIGETRQDRVGVWVRRPRLSPLREDKIAAIGIRVRRWVSFHGLSINVCPNLEHFSGIVPCGVADHGVTSLHDLGLETMTLWQVDAALCASFNACVGQIGEQVEPPLSL